MRCLRIASRTWFRKKSRKSGAQKAALWRGISTSRRGFRRMTFTASPRASRLRKPRRTLDVADLGEVDRVVSALKLPPLREVEITEAEVLEAERARIDGRELLDGLSAPLPRGLHGRDQLAQRLPG